MSHKNGEDKDKRPDEELKKFPLLNIEYDLYYHGIKPLKKIDLTRFKLLSIVFVVLGLLVVYYLATASPAIYASIQDVYGNYLYNYAVVVVEGNITETPSVRVDNQGRFAVYFTINDGTGSISARIYDPLARKALALGKVPGVGDHVKAELQIRVLETYTYGIVQSLDTLKITHIYDIQKPKPVASISTDMVGEYVEINGSIVSVRKTSSGLYLINVNTGLDTITVVLPNYLKYVNGVLDQKTGELHPNPKYDETVKKLVIGAEVRVRGVVHLYRTMPEIIINRLSDIRVSTEVAGLVTLDQIVFNNKEYVGKFVTIDNVWIGPISYDRNSGNYFVEIYDDTYHTTAIFQSSQFKEEFNPFEVGTGSRASIIGAVCNDSTIAVVNFNITEKRPSPLLTPSQVTRDLIGYMVALNGTVITSSSTGGAPQSYGCPICDYYHGVSSVGSVYKFQLADPDHPEYKITIFMPSSAYNYLDPDLRELVRTNGSRVIVAGYITTYMDQLEIVVYSSQGVMQANQVPPGYGYSIPETPRYKPIHVITPISEAVNKLGEKVIIDAYLDTITTSAGWYVLKVHDSTGSIDVYVSIDQLKRINPFHGAPGSELIITGKVSGRKNRYLQAIDISLYQGNPTTLKQIRNLNRGLVGQIVAVKGTVTEVSGNTLKIDDGTGVITVKIDPSVTLPTDKEQLLRPGEKITVAGILFYEGLHPVILVYSDAGIQPGDYEWTG